MNYLLKSFVIFFTLLNTLNAQTDLYRPVNFTSSIAGPMLIMFRWNTPRNGTPSQGYDLRILPTGSSAAFKLIKPSIPGNSTSFLLEMSSTNVLLLSIWSTSTVQAAAVFVRGVEYSFFLVPQGTESEAKTVIRAMTAPGPPSAVSATRLALALRVAWAPPADDGTAYAEGGAGSLLSYDVELLGGAATAATVGASAAAALFEALPRGAALTPRVRARNAAGPGPFAAAPAALVVIGPPSAPGAVAVTTGLAGGARLAAWWDPPADTGDGGNASVPAEFVLEVSPDAGFAASVSEFPTRAERRAQLRGGLDLPLDAGAVYYLRARARNEVGDGPTSPPTARRIVGAPGPPGACLLRTVGARAMRLSWAAPADLGAGAGAAYPLLGFDVAVYNASGAPGAGWPPAGGGWLRAVAPDADGVGLGGLAKGALIRAAVRAVNDASLDNNGRGAWAAAGGECAADPGAVCGAQGLTAVDVPSAPPGLALSYSAENPRTLEARWGLPSDTGDGSPSWPLRRYELNVTAWDGGAPRDLLTVQPDGVTRCATPEYPLGSYRAAWVRAVNEAGPGPWSAAARAVVLLLPSPPTGLALAAAGLTTFNLTFDPPVETGLGNSTWPLAEFQTAIGEACGVVAALPETVVSFSPQQGNSVLMLGMQKGCTYTVRLRARNEAGWGNFSANVSRMFLVRSTAPMGFNVSNGAALEILLVWDTPLDAGDGKNRTESLVQYYFVEIATDQQFRNILRTFGTVRSKSISVGGLSYGVGVFCRVAAVTAEGLGAFSTKYAIPTFPRLLQTSIIFGSNLTGAKGPVLVSFRTSSTLGPNDVVCVTFPIGFDISGTELDFGATATFGSARVESQVFFPCGYNCNSSSLINAFIFREDGPVLPKGTFISFQLLQIVNRGWAGNPGAFQIRTLAPEGNVTIDADLNVVSPTLAPGLLLNPVFSLSSYITGEITSGIVSFSLSERNPFPKGGIIVLTLPEYLAPQSNFEAVLRTSDLNVVSAQVFISGPGPNISFQNQGDEIAKQSLLRVVISGIKNRDTQGNTGPISIRTLSSNGGAIDQFLDFGGLSIVPGNLTEALVVVDDSSARGITTYRFSFRCGAVGLEAKSLIALQFPSIVFVENAFIMGDSEYSVDGSSRGSTLIVSRISENAIISYGRVSFDIQGVQNYYVGYTGSIQVRTLSFLNSLVMEQVNLSGVIYTPIPIEIGINVESPYCAAAGFIYITLNTYSNTALARQSGGKLMMKFPAGFYCPDDSLVSMMPDIGMKSKFEYGIVTYITPGSGNSNYVFQPCPTLPGYDENTRCSTWLTVEWFDNSLWPSASVLRITVSSCINSVLSGYSGGLTVTLSNRQNSVLGMNTSASLLLRPLFVPEISILPNALIPDSEVELFLTFPTLRGFPRDWVLLLTLPNGFQLVSGVALQMIDDGNNNYIYNISRIESTKTQTNITSMVYSVVPTSFQGTKKKLRIVGLTTIDSVGSSGNISISFRTVDGRLFAYNDVVIGPYLRFMPAEITMIHRSNMPKSAGISLSVTGSNFGTNKRKRVLSLGITPCTPITWTSETSIGCISMPGSPADSQGGLVILSIENLVSTAMQAFSFDQPVLSSLEVKNNPPRVSLLSMFGDDFGLFSLSPFGRNGQTSCASSVWASDTAMFCRSSLQLPYMPVVSLTVSNGLGSLTTSLSADLSIVSSLQNVNSKFSSNSQLVLLGKGFGSFSTSHTLKFGTSSSERTSWQSQTSIRGNCQRGVSSTLTSVITASFTLISTMTESFSYDSEIAIFGASSTNVVAGIERQGLSLVLDIRKGIFSHNGQVGITSIESSNWVSDSSILCFVATGYASTMAIALSVASRVASLSEFLSYNALSSLETGKTTNVLVNRMDTIFIIAKFDSSQATPQTARLSFGGTACRHTSWLTASTITCKYIAGSPSASPGSNVLTIQQRVGSVSDLFSFNTLLLSARNTFNGPPKRNSNIQMFGSNLGGFDVSPDARLGFSSCSSTQWTSDTSLQSMSASGISGPLSIVISALSLQVSTSSRSFTYDAPLVTNTSSDPLYNVLYLRGQNFGVTDNTLQAFVGQCACEATTWIADSSVQCTLNLPLDDQSHILPSYICKRCLPTEIISGCSPSNLGTCAPCASCDAGFYRDGCVPGTSKRYCNNCSVLSAVFLIVFLVSGVCRPCKNDPTLPVGSREFKSSEGLSCSMCLVCGGPNQNGSQYEKAACTRTKDTVCTQCPTCSKGIRLGCAGQSSGYCVDVPNELRFCAADSGRNPWTVQCSSSIAGIVKQLSSNKYLAVTNLLLALTGNCRGSNLSIAQSTVIETSNPGEPLTFSQLQCDSNNSSQTFSNTSHSMTFPGGQVFYLGLADTRVTAPINISLVHRRLPSLRRETKDSAISLVCWNRVTERWVPIIGERIDNDDSVIVTAQLDSSILNFSVCAFAEIVPFNSNAEPFTSLAIIIPAAITCSCIVLAVGVLIYRARTRVDKANVKTHMSKRAIEHLEQPSLKKQKMSIKDDVDLSTDLQADCSSLTAKYLHHGQAESLGEDQINSELNSPHRFVSSPGPRRSGRDEMFEIPSMPFVRSQFDPAYAQDLSHDSHFNSSEGMRTGNSTARYLEMTGSNLIALEGRSHESQAQPRHLYVLHPTPFFVGNSLIRGQQGLLEIQQGGLAQSKGTSTDIDWNDNPVLQDRHCNDTADELFSKSHNKSVQAELSKNQDQYLLISGGPAGNPSQPPSVCASHMTNQSLAADTSFSSSGNIGIRADEIEAKEDKMLANTRCRSTPKIDLSFESHSPQALAVDSSIPGIAPVVLKFTKDNLDPSESCSEPSIVHNYSKPTHSNPGHHENESLRFQNILGSSTKESFFPQAISDDDSESALTSLGVRHARGGSSRSSALRQVSRRSKHGTEAKMHRAKHQNFQALTNCSISRQSDTDAQSISEWSSTSSVRHSFSHGNRSLNDSKGGYSSMSEHDRLDRQRQNPFNLQPYDKAGNSLCAQQQMSSLTEPCFSHTDSWNSERGQVDLRKGSVSTSSSNSKNFGEGIFEFQIKGPLVSENIHLSQGSLFDEYVDEIDVDDLMVDAADDFDFPAPKAQVYSTDHVLPGSRFQIRDDPPEALFNALAQEGAYGTEEQHVYESYALLDLPTTSADSSGAPERMEDESNAVISLRPQTRLFLRSHPVDGAEDAMTPRPTSVRASSNLSPQGQNAASLSPTLVAEMPSTPNMRAMDMGHSAQVPSSGNEFSFEGEEHFLHFR